MLNLARMFLPMHVQCPEPEHLGGKLVLMVSSHEFVMKLCLCEWPSTVFKSKVPVKVSSLGFHQEASVT